MWYVSTGESSLPLRWQLKRFQHTATGLVHLLPSMQSHGRREPAVAIVQAVKPSEVQDASDPVLVAMARKSVPTAVDALIDRHYSAVQRFIARQICDSDFAQDLTQEVFATAFEHLAQLKDDAAFLPWLYRIARNRCHSSHRGTISWTQIAVIDWIDNASSVRTKVSARDHAIEEIDEADMIQHVLDRLRPSYRELLLLRHLAGFSLDEVAAIIGCSRATTQRRINRAEASFRHHYATVEARQDGRQAT